MITKARGQLAHYFHGNYWAQIGLQFESPYAAEQVGAKLGNGWHTRIEHRNVLVWVGNSEELNACEDILESFGADRSKISSLAKSIDSGEPFEIQAQITPQEQLSLL